MVVVVFVLIFHLLLGMEDLIECRLASSRDHVLYTHLFTNYNKQLPPVNEEGKVRVHISLGLQNLIDVHEKEQFMETSGTITMIWSDHLLSWNSSEYGGRCATDLLILSTS